MALPAADKLARKRELIAQMLAKAESTPYPAEAEAFQEQAERMMVKLGIEQAEIDAERGKLGQTQEEIVAKRYEFTGTYKEGRFMGYYKVARAFNTIHAIRSKGRSSWTMHLVGAESDVDQIVQLFDSMTLQCNVAMKSWWAGVGTWEKHYMTEHQKRMERRTFIMGFADAVAGRIAAIYQEESAGKELVLVGRKDRAEKEANKLFKTKTESTRLTAGSNRAAGAGHQAGQRATINRTMSRNSNLALV